MNMKKNVIGCVSLLILVLILSQSRMLEMLINTTLGRVILVSVIVLLSCINKIAGVVGVLLVIIMFNSSNFRLRLEGFDTSTDGEKSMMEKNQPKENEKQKEKEKQKDNEQKKDNTQKAALAAEGFDVIGLENSIKRGKQSNSIPVKERSTSLDDDVYAYEGSSMFGFFSPW